MWKTIVKSIIMFAIVVYLIANIWFAFCVILTLI